MGAGLETAGFGARVIQIAGHIMNERIIRLPGSVLVGNAWGSESHLHTRIRIAGGIGIAGVRIRTRPPMIGIEEGVQRRYLLADRAAARRISPGGVVVGREVFFVLLWIQGIIDLVDHPIRRGAGPKKVCVPQTNIGIAGIIIGNLLI